MALFRPFAGLTNRERLSDRVTILRFRHLLEKHRLDVQILATVNATIQQQENVEGYVRSEIHCWTKAVRVAGIKLE